MLYVIKKDGTREEFNPQKIVAAVNKSAERILYTFSDEEKDFICRFARSMRIPLERMRSRSRRCTTSWKGLWSV